MAADASVEWLIEIGHSRLKLAPYAAGEISTVTAMPIAEFDQWLASVLQSQGHPLRAWLCAVPEEEVVQPVLSALSNFGIETRRIRNNSVELPVALSYPGLGVDRWLALQPVWQRLESAFVLVDFGTATTIDAVDVNGTHHGGWILPGREASRQGLIASVPGLKRPDNAMGKDDFAWAAATDTFDAIERGLILQQTGAIALVLASLQKSMGQAIQVVLTGGDARCIGPALDTTLSIVAQPEPDTNAISASTLQLPHQTVLTAPDLVLEGLAMAAEQLR